MNHHDAVAMPAPTPTSYVPREIGSPVPPRSAPPTQEAVPSVVVTVVAPTPVQHSGVVVSFGPTVALTGVRPTGIGPATHGPQMPKTGDAVALWLGLGLALVAVGAIALGLGLMLRVRGR